FAVPERKYSEQRPKPIQAKQICRRNWLKDASRQAPCNTPLFCLFSTLGAMNRGVLSLCDRGRYPCVRSYLSSICAPAGAFQLDTMLRFFGGDYETVQGHSLFYSVSLCRCSAATNHH